jgi:hypothetical protein
MSLNGLEESRIKGDLYREFREVVLEKLKRENPGEYNNLIRNSQEYEHQRWLYVQREFTRINNNLKKDGE